MPDRSAAPISTTPSSRPPLPVALARQIHPVSPARDRALPVSDALGSLFPAGLPRGVTLAVSGGAARSFLFAVTVAATQAGSWLSVLGLTDPGWRAAVEAGIITERIIVVDPAASAERGAECVAAALDGFDLVVVGAALPLGNAQARRLAARARERGAVLIAETGPLTTVADITVDANGEHWQGLGSGWGHLTGRRVTVRAEGKRLPGRRRRAELWLPDATGGIDLVDGTTTSDNVDGHPFLVDPVIADPSSSRSPSSRPSSSRPSVTALRPRSA